jgi:hypothetical protein
MVRCRKPNSADEGVGGCVPQQELLMNTDQNFDFVSFTGLSGGNSRPPRTLWKFLLSVVQRRTDQRRWNQILQELSTATESELRDLNR